jgi:hypothetical protein
MAEIFLAYSGLDSELADALSDELVAAGHSVTMDRELFGDPVDGWRDRLGPALRRADACVAIFTTNTTGGIFETEVITAITYSSSSGRLAVVPVKLEDAPIPKQFSELQFIVADQDKLSDTAAQISHRISQFMGLLIANQQKASDVAEKVERNLAEYLDDAVSSQGRLEGQNWLSGTIWYVIGIFSLFAGVGITFFLLDRPASLGSSEQLFAISKSIAIVGFLGAGARYCFVLGKSYMNESLKNSDRIHAIQFGRFYLRAFGDRTTWQELKEVFSNWNISNASSFASLKAGDVDPKIVESIVDIFKSTQNKRAPAGKPH